MDNNNFTENGNSNIMPPQDNLPQNSLLHIALRNRSLILTTTVLFLVFGFLYLLKVTPIYNSCSRLYVEQSGPRIINEYQGIMTQSKNYLYTQGELIKSMAIVGDVAEDSQIKRLNTFTNIDNIAGYLKGNVNVDIGKKNDILAVSAETAYPEESALIVNKVVEYYKNYHSSSKKSTVLKVLEILQKEKITRDAELNQALEDMLKFAEVNGVVSFENKGEHVVFRRLAKLSESLTETQLATLNAKADYEAALSMSDEPENIKQFAYSQPSSGVRILVNDVENQLRMELKNAEVELENARYHLTDKHPSVKAIETKIKYINDQLNEQARKFADGYIERMRLRWLTAKQREDELGVSYEVQCAAAQQLGIKATRYSMLRTKLTRAERGCEIIDERIKDLNVTKEDIGALNISILEYARAAGSPSKPQKAKVMAVAMILGFMLGSGLALVRDWLDHRLRSVEEITAALGIAVLGVVPSMEENDAEEIAGQNVFVDFKERLFEFYQRVYSAVAMGGQGILGVGTDKVKPILNKQDIAMRGQKVRFKSKSTVAEAYRTIRTAIFFGVPKDRAKTILITSPAPGDGKSTFVSNLAITMAQASQKTLIIDADFRKPMQHNIFGIESGHGLAGVLSGSLTLEEAMSSDVISGLDVLVCGREVPNPSELLNSESFVKLLKDLAEKYDRIIIDSPPVAPVADSQILSAICDVTLLVLRAEKSTRRLSQQARDVLLSVGGNLLGAVVNDVDRKHGRYDYYSGYGYYSGYSHYGRYGHYGYYGNGDESRQNRKGEKVRQS